MCVVDENLCQARMEKVANVEKGIEDIQKDFNRFIELAEKQDRIISTQTTRIALIEQQLAILKWVSSAAIGAVILLLVNNAWKIFVG